MEERQTNYTIMEGYELPSRGLIYDKHVDAHVELRSMTARDEMKRQAPSTQKIKVMADIIEGCLVERPAVHVYDMAIGDYTYLLHKLRVVTYGTKYKMLSECPHCGKIVTLDTDLDTLEVKDFDIEEFNKLRIVKLPKSGNLVSLGYETPRIFDEIAARTKELERKFPKAGINFEDLVTLKLLIEAVDGENLNSSALENFINNLPAADFNLLKNRIVKISNMIGENASIKGECTNCGGEVETFFRHEPEFYRPAEE